jgi:hypothetical protein
MSARSGQFNVATDRLLSLPLSTAGRPGGRNEIGFELVGWTIW